MSYFAKIEGNIVQNVIVATSLDWCCSCLGGTWVETFKDTPSRNYAGIGYLYFPQAANGQGDFLAPIPEHPSWVVANITGTLRWEPPFPSPDDGNIYIWDENTVQWTFLNYDIPTPSIPPPLDGNEYTWDSNTDQWILQTNTPHPPSSSLTFRNTQVADTDVPPVVVADVTPDAVADVTPVVEKKETPKKSLPRSQIIPKKQMANGKGKVKK